MKKNRFKTSLKTRIKQSATGKLIKRLRIIALILIILQIILISVFCVFYFNNFFLLQNYKLTPYILIASCSGLVLIDCLFSWIAVTRVSALKQKTDLHAAEVIGGDVQEAYNFAMVGLAVTDENGNVIWTNDLFTSRHIDIIDMNIFEWHEDLLPLKESANPDMVVKIFINSRNYEVKFLSEAGLWIFKDNTDYESIYSYSREQAPVVGVLAIDNYDDVIRGEDDFNDIVSKVKNVIFTYAKDFGILLRRIKDDNYAMLCNYESFLKMKEDNFSIIDKVREVGFGEKMPLTLSLGIAHDFPDVIKLNDLANEALDIAMSRGGDQIVISAFGQEMEFYGGKFEATEKRNRVTVRVLADSLLSLLKSAKNVLIMGHTNMDMDAFGACLGIKTMCDRLKQSSKIVVDLKATEYKTRSAITSSFNKEILEELIVSSKDAESLINVDTLLVVVDVHIPDMVMAPKALDKCSKVVVIDHHRRAEEYIENPVFNHIDATASSSCELIAEFIKFASINPKIVIPPLYATFMLSGIFLDSSNFKSRSTGIKTFEASTILKEYGADNAMADDFLKDEMEEHILINKMLDNIEFPYNGIILVTYDSDNYVDAPTIAKVANSCMTFKGTHAVFVIASTGNKEVKISARSDGSINVQLLLEKIGGGGHFSAAAAAFEKTNVQAVKVELLSAIEMYINDAKRDIRRKGEED